MSYEDYVERAAKNVGTDTATLNGRAETVLTEHQNEWSAAGRSEEDCKMMALRVAARLLRSESERVKKSGCDLYEGMFLTVPRYKDWSELAYNKMGRTLMSANDMMQKTLVTEGKVVVFTKQGGEWTKEYNPSLEAKEKFQPGHESTTVAELPEIHRFVEGGTSKAFYLVWDANSPTWPSGDSNFKYGAPRPLKELQRDCLFVGRVQGTNGPPKPLSVRFNGVLAQTQNATYLPGTIALRTGKNGTVAYGKPGVSTFVGNSDIASIFAGPPVDLSGDTASGIVTEHASAWLDSLDDILPFTDTLTDDNKWDAWVAAATEVIHIDPRDRGGYIVTVGDLDLASSAPTIDIYVPAEHESLVDFGVGSTVMVVGGPWVSREGEGRLAVSGWWCIDAISPASGGWDE